MAQLPDSLPLDAPQGARTPAEAVAPTDFGLGNIADSVGQAAAFHRQVNETLNDRVAQTKIQAIQSQFAPQMAQDAARYTADDPPGFAQGQLAKLDALYQPALAGTVSPGVQRAMNSRYAELKAQIGNQAIGIEADKRAAPIAAQQAAKDNTIIAQAVANYTGLRAPLDTNTENSNLDGDQWGAQKMANHAQAMSEALAMVPDRLQGEVSSRLSAEGVSVAAAAPGAAYQRNIHFLTQGVLDSTNHLAGAVAADPTAYASAQKQGAAITASLPDVMKFDANKEFTQTIGEANGRGLLAKDELTELQHFLDTAGPENLKPSDQERLQDRLRVRLLQTQSSSADGVLAHAAAQQDLDAATQTMTATGVDDGYDPTKDPRLTPREQAEAGLLKDQAVAKYLAQGSLPTKSNADLNAIATTPPPPMRGADGAPDPQYGAKLSTWKMANTAANAEITARAQDPAAANLRSSVPGDLGDQARQAWMAFTGGAGKPADPAKAGTYAGLQLGRQALQGTPYQAMRVLSKDQAQGLVGSYTHALPQDQPKQLAALAAMITAMPASLKLSSGANVNARQFALRDLAGANLEPATIAAITDLADNANGLRAYATAATNSAAGRPLPDKEETPLQTALRAALAPYQQSTAPLPGAAELTAGRLEWASTVARNLVLTRGMSIQAAAQQAAAPLNVGYRFQDGYRVPRAVADIQGGPFHDGLGMVADGMTLAMHDLTENGGAMLYAAGGPASSLNAAQKQARLAGVLPSLGRWVTTPDDSGAQLTMASPAGGYAPISDKYGRPVILTWHQLQARSGFSTGNLVNLNPYDPAMKGWLKPPPPPPPASTAPVAPAPAGAIAPEAPGPAYSNAAKFRALSAAIEHQESGGDPTIVSGKGATGLMQLMPATAQAAAGRMGVGYNPSMLTDPTWNRRLGENEIQHQLDLAHGNVALALAGYNAGDGHLYGMTDPKTGAYNPGWTRTIGDPRAGAMSVTDFVNRIPFAETRDYVRRVLPDAVRRLKGGG